MIAPPPHSRLSPLSPGTHFTGWPATANGALTPHGNNDTHLGRYGGHPLYFFFYGDGVALRCVPRVVPLGRLPSLLPLPPYFTGAEGTLLTATSRLLHLTCLSPLGITYEIKIAHSLPSPWGAEIITSMYVEVMTMRSWVNHVRPLSPLHHPPSSTKVIARKSKCRYIVERATLFTLRIPIYSLPGYGSTPTTSSPGFRAPYHRVEATRRG